MTFSKLRLAPGMALVVSMSCFCVSQAQPVWSQEQEQQAPADGEQTTPEQAAPEQTAPTDDSNPAQPSGDSTEPSAAPSEQAPADSGATTEAPQNNTEAPAQQEQPAATESAPAEGGAAVDASQIQIGAAVFGADGAKIGEVNGVKSDDSGKVQEILVTDGMPAGINAKVFEIPADKITSVADGVKLSLTSEEAKQLPVIDNSKG